MKTASPEPEERPPSRLTHSGTLFQRSLREIDRRPKTTVRSLRSSGWPPVSFMVFEDQSLPHQEASVDRRFGTQKGKRPFRISQIEVRRQIHEAMDSRVEEEKAMMKRPATTNSLMIQLGRFRPDN
jgi:hypothetical protein